MKKVCLVLLCFVLVATVLPCGFVSAEESGPVLSLDHVILKPDSRTATVTLSMQNNPGLICGSIAVEAPAGFTLESWSDTGLFGESTHSPVKPYRNPYLLCWANDLIPENITANGDLITLTYTVDDSVAPGTYEIKLLPTGSRCDFYDFDLVVKEATRINGSITVPSVKKNGTGAVTDIVIPDGAVSVDGDTFRNLPDLKTVTVPDSVTALDDDAFAESPDVTIIGNSDVVKQYAERRGLRAEEVATTGWILPVCLGVVAVLLITVAVLAVLSRKKNAAETGEEQE